MSLPKTIQLTDEYLIRKARKAVYSGIKRAEIFTTTPADIADMQQEAATVIWTLVSQGKPMSYAFAAARQEAIKCLYRQCRGRTAPPLNLIAELDAPANANTETTLGELLPAPDFTDPEAADYWLTDQQLDEILIASRIAAGDYCDPNHKQHAASLAKDKETIRLAVRGHTNEHIALETGTTTGTVKWRRQKIRRRLEALLPPEAIPYWDKSGGSQKRANHIQQTYPNKRKPR